jgi:hypothetical protein
METILEVVSKELERILNLPTVRLVSGPLNNWSYALGVLYLFFFLLILVTLCLCGLNPKSLFCHEDTKTLRNRYPS